MVFTSTYADITVPEIDAASFVIKSERFQANPDKPASVDALTGKSLTFQQVHDQSLAFATGLKTELGLEAWSVVALYSANNIHYGSLVYGTLLAGCTVTTANSTYTVEELLYQLKDSAASVLIVDKDTLANGLLLPNRLASRCPRVCDCSRGHRVCAARLVALLDGAVHQGRVHGR
ncbi:hypothetical protein BC831DRAFT_297499 [Entophlyctis helioformis]|nr:hypothetical protein BC831DRAFT_297499 [Entophlyctis helioformis]